MVLHEAVDVIADALQRRDLDEATRAWNSVLADNPAHLQDLLRRLGATVTVPAGMVVWGFGKDVWANPIRSDYGWRCGDCRWTGSLYASERAAKAAAERHAADDHPASRPAVVSYLDDAYWDSVDAA